MVGDRVRVCGEVCGAAAVVIDLTMLWCCGKRIVKLRTDAGKELHVCQNILVPIDEALAGFGHA